MKYQYKVDFFPGGTNCLGYFETTNNNQRKPFKLCFGSERGEEIERERREEEIERERERER